MTTTAFKKINKPPRPALRKGRSKGMRNVIAALDQRDLSLSWLADKLELSRQGVSRWDRVPDDYIRSVCSLLSLPREKVRPDLYDW